MGEKKRRSRGGVSARKHQDKYQHKHSDEWRGFRFLGVALGITVAASLFFFAFKSLYPQVMILQRDLSAFVGEKVKDWSGIRLSAINLVIEPKGDDVLLGVYEKQIKDELKGVEGQSYWGMSPARLQRRLAAFPWVESANVARHLPADLFVQVKLRTPRFLVRTKSQWALVDEEGRVLALSREIPGIYASLPLVLGREDFFSRSSTVAGLNRHNEGDRLPLTSLSRLLTHLENSLDLVVDRIELTNDLWTEDVVATLEARKDSGETSRDEVFTIALSLKSWPARMESLQYVLSDLDKRKVLGADILGQFRDRWIVSKRRVDDGKGISGPRGR